MQIEEVNQIYERIINQVERVFVGQPDVTHAVVVAILARGHILLEGVPGLGKTLLVRCLAKVLGCHFRRVQFTPDLMPSDVTGSVVYNSSKGAFEFKHGPVFTHLLLADEVNRAPAKTQAAMLECMAERSVTVEGRSRPLPNPFLVLATQNPIESAGTYPLPEAQPDRFLFKIIIEPPAEEHELQLLRNVVNGFDAAELATSQLEQVVSVEQITQIQAALQQIKVDEEILAYITQLVQTARKHRSVLSGPSPRASIALLSIARVQAAINGRDFVIPDDVKSFAKPVLRHRLLLQPDTSLTGLTADAIIQSVLQEVPVPGMKEKAE